MSKILFEIPENWSWATMAEIADVIGGGTPKTKISENFQNGTIPWLTPSDLSGYTGKFIAGGSRFITEMGLGSSAARMMPEGTVLFTSRAPIGYVAIASNDICTNQGFKSFVLKSKDILPEYVYWWLKGNKELAESYASGTTFLELSGSKAKQLPIPLAPLEQQKRIVAEIEKQFSRLDEAVANLKRVKANLKRYKAAVLKAAVEGKLTEEWRKQRPDAEPADKLLERILAERREMWQGRGKYKEPAAPDTTDLPELPKGWVWAISDQLLSFVTSGSRGWAKYYSESGSVFLRMGNLDHDTIALDLTDIQRVDPPLNSEGTRTRVAAGDILISITADVGMVGLVPDDLEEAYINQHVSLARPVRLDCSDFIAWFFACKAGQDQFRSLQRGATKVGLGLDDIKAVYMPVPPLPEQRAILAEIDRHLSVIDGAEAQIDTNLRRADRLRQSILKQAFSGQLVKRNASNKDTP